ncbi:MAG: hypothetical protein IJL52_08840 [Clostridia bacterium]|nr:hypothetical protein [Clostridia bacterium]
MRKAYLALLALVLCLILAACGQGKDDAATTETAAATTKPTTESTTEPPTEPVKKDWNVTPVKNDGTIHFDEGRGTEIHGCFVETDENGIRLVDAKTGKKTTITDDGSWICAFDGDTILYCQRRVDPTVDFDRSYIFSYEEEPITAQVYEVDDVMSYDVATEKTEKLFTKYCTGGSIVYFNNNVVYYEDIKKSQIGYKNGYDPYRKCLYSYDLKTDERKIVLADSFYTGMEEISGKPCIEMEDGVYDISTATPTKLYSIPHGSFCWTDGTYVYAVEHLGYDDDDNEQYAIWAYKISDGTEEKLKEYTISEEMRFFTNEFWGRYVMCGADVTKTQKAKTVNYSATKYHVYDLLTRKTIEVDPMYYDEVTFVDGVMVTWIDIGGGKNEIWYYDDDGNQIYYDTWKIDGELDSIKADGYCVSTDIDENGNDNRRFIESPLEFLQE